jgi:acyl-coenzyme A thioesterase PaaI-like protein
VSQHEPRSTTHPVLSIHPDADVTPEIAASRRMALATRRLVAGLVNTGAPAATLERAADQLEELADQLAPFARSSRYEGTPGVVLGGDNRVILESHPMMGPSNPIAPPLTISREPDRRRAYAEGTYGHAYEGPPGRLHGGFIAAAFDQVIGAAAALAGHVFLTGLLTVRYRAATPLHVPLRFEAELDRVESRRLHASGRLVVDGTVTADGEGVFIVVDDQVFHEG